MPSINDYALLSNRVYFRTPINRSVVAASGWAEKQWTRDQAATGFSAGVYQKGTEVVIAYTGTNERRIADFVFGNIPAATGLYPSDQVWAAMDLYFKVARDNPAANITFTGHSTVGSAGRESLVRGKGDDTLDGGDAADIYEVASYACTSSIACSEAADRLRLSGHPLNGDSTMISDRADLKLWVDLSNPARTITYRFEMHTRTLAVMSAGSGVDMNNFVEGDMGILIPRTPEYPRNSKTSESGINNYYCSALPAPVRSNSPTSQRIRSYA